MPQYKIVQRKGKWQTRNPYISNDPFYFDIIVDIKNGYMQISDPGTGGGSQNYTFTLFYAKKKRIFLGIQYESFGTIEGIFTKPVNIHFP